MANPQFLSEKPLSLVDVKAALERIEKRDDQPTHLSTKTKEYLDLFVTLSSPQQDALRQKLQGLQLTRLKEEHIAKIIDFLPHTVNELKIVLQAYPLSLPKKDQESIVQAVKDAVEKKG